MESQQDNKCEGGKYIITATIQTSTQCQQEYRHQSPDACLVMVYIAFKHTSAKRRDNAI